MTQKVDIETALPAILEAAATYREACEEFEAALEQAKERLNKAANTIVAAVEMGREVGLDIGDPFDNADPVGKAFGHIRLVRHPIRLFCEI